MTPTRLSALFLAVATFSGAAGLDLPALALGSDSWTLPDAWASALRATCIAALVAFLITFLVTLDRSALVRR